MQEDRFRGELKRCALPPHFAALAFVPHTRRDGADCAAKKETQNPVDVRSLLSYCSCRKSHLRDEVSMHVDMACLSSKGQFVIPGKYRDILKLTAGSKLVIVCDGTHLLLKPINRRTRKLFRQVVKHTHELTRQAEATKAKEARK